MSFVSVKNEPVEDNFNDCSAVNEKCIKVERRDSCESQKDTSEEREIAIDFLGKYNNDYIKIVLIPN